MQSISGFQLARAGAAIMLLVAVLPWPFGYYTLTRLVVCAVAAYSAMRANERHQTGWVWVFGATVVLFNPVFPLRLDRQTWAVLDVVVAAIFIATFFVGLFRDQATASTGTESPGADQENQDAKSGEGDADQLSVWQARAYSQRRELSPDEVARLAVRREAAERSQAEAERFRKWQDKVSRK